MNKARNRWNEREFLRCLDEKQTIRGVKKSRRNKERKTKRERIKKKRERSTTGEEIPFLASSFQTREKMVKFGKPEARKTVEKENSYGRGNEKFQESYRRPEKAPGGRRGGEKARETGRQTLTMRKRATATGPKKASC